MPRASSQTKQSSAPLPKDLQVSDVRGIKVYLKKHSDLAALVPSVCQRLRAEFGPKADLFLDLYKDPEEPEPYLLLRVRLVDYDTQTMERIYKVTEEFDRELTDASGWLQVTTDFRIPQGNHVL